MMFRAFLPVKARFLCLSVVRPLSREKNKIKCVDKVYGTIFSPVEIPDTQAIDLYLIPINCINMFYIVRYYTQFMVTQAPFFVDGVPFWICLLYTSPSPRD